ncbi:hypothetical protein [Caulobacter sp. 602-1]|uniref:hypothetical protein n=1 Tax=Caulobacter sp. 602-1 TaxID=2492472 RepID=UPI000F63D00F|nr:hypothetical protein [Caulobacter sp. 602-1]RRN64658.1 hypothetical protein EIK80_11525 [Caulobacter sp. 602-1]
MRSFKNGRPRKSGDRYPSGKLKPDVKPNSRVVAMRRALLGAKDGEAVDLTKTEHPLDLALARGWLTQERYDAAQLFIRLYRGIRFPVMAVSRDPSDLGVLSKEDRALIGEKLNWANMPSADVNRLFDAVVMAARPSTPAPRQADPLPVVPGQLREIWAVLKPEQARELFSVAILGHWPQWVIWQARGEVVPGPARRRQRLLIDGLETIVSGNERSRFRQRDLVGAA